MTFLTPNDPDAFLDHPRQEPTRPWAPIECPRCSGYGGWNLKINAYPMRNIEDTPMNRHLYSHFRTTCNHCNGYGYISQELANRCPGHEWEFVENRGRCLNRYQCQHCGQINDVDSSD
jgi:hypothetical protein